MTRVEQRMFCFALVEDDEFTGKSRDLAHGETEELMWADYEQSRPKPSKSCNLENPECCESCQ